MYMPPTISPIQGQKKAQLHVLSSACITYDQGCGVGVGIGIVESEGILAGVGVGTHFNWSRSRKELLGGVGVGKNVSTPTSA
jgi:hypothetical protein